MERNHRDRRPLADVDDLQLLRGLASMWAEEMDQEELAHSATRVRAALERDGVLRPPNLQNTLLAFRFKGKQWGMRDASMAHLQELQAELDDTERAPLQPSTAAKGWALAANVCEDCAHLADVLREAADGDDPLSGIDLTRAVDGAPMLAIFAVELVAILSERAPQVPEDVGPIDLGFTDQIFRLCRRLRDRSA